jgi:hypothetical protein
MLSSDLYTWTSRPGLDRCVEEVTKMDFNTVIRSEAELRELMGDPVAPSVVEKTLSSLEENRLC